jgi:hypothetical protein
MTNALPSLIALMLAAVLPAGEVPPAKSIPCFPGAYYRKAVSSQDVWTGIEGVVTLPTPAFDEARRRPNNPAQFLDNPSVYMGGRGGETEIDAGLTWEIVQEPDGKTSTDRKAFRPFWRNKKWFAGPADVNYYFWPGDTIRIAIWTEAKDKLTMKIELVERGPTGLAQAKRYAPTTRPAEPLVVHFDAHGWGPGRVQEFKRVNAIDLVGREGKSVQETRTVVAGAVWRECYLLRGDGDRRPFVPERFTDMRCPDPRFFTVAPGDATRGGESIEIHGSGAPPK